MSHARKYNSAAKVMYAVLGILLLTSPAFSGPVHVITIDGSINPATADYIHESILNASSANAECIIIRLNTPGGLLQSTRDIVTDFLTAPLPVVVYVSPSGAQSASAGAFLTLAAHVAVMAPGTNIGAAHPVGMQGDQPDSVMNEKATNDAAAFIRTISEKRNRNIEWAEDAVRKSISYTETEALRENVIDLIAPSLASLLDSLQGWSLTIDERIITLETIDAGLVEHEMGLKHKILNTLSDPNIAYIFLMLGIYGLMFELYNPGSMFPGVVGVISLIIAFYSLTILPVNYAGLALIIVAIILFILEIKVASYGLLTIGGLATLFLGSLMLIDPDSPLEIVAISWSLIIPVVIFSALFFGFVIGMGIRAQKRQPTTGQEGIVGERGKAITNLSPTGKVMVHGEIWNAVSSGGKIRDGAVVIVEGISNLTLTVRDGTER